MRYTTETEPDARAVPTGETWVGIVPDPYPRIVVASRLDEKERDLIANRGERVVLFGSYNATAARAMGEHLIQLALALEAPNN